MIRALLVFCVCSLVALGCTRQSVLEPDGAFETLTESQLELVGEGGRRKLLASESFLETRLRRTDVSSAVMARAWGELAMTRHSFGFPGASLGPYSMAGELEPEDYRWPYLRAVALHNLNQISQAADSLETALALRPAHAPALILLGEIRFGEGDVAAAHGLWERAAEAHPSAAAAWYSLGRLAAARKDHRAAIELFEKTLELEPSADRAHYSLALAYRSLGDTERVEHHLGLRGETPPAIFDPLVERMKALNPQYFMRNGAEALREGNLELGATLLARALPDSPENHLLRLQLGKVRADLGDLSSALALFREALAMAPEDASVRYHLGTAHLMRGAYPEALIQLQEAVRLDPEHALARFNLAHALRHLDRREEALPHLQETTRIDPSYLDGYVMRVLILTELGQCGSARTAFDELRALDSQVPELVEIHTKLEACRDEL